MSAPENKNLPGVPTPAKDENVCANQDTFNESLKAAAKHFRQEREDEMKKNKNLYMVAGLMYLVLLVWALVLAMKISDREHRVLHTVVALVCPPAYVLSHYLSGMKKM